MKPLTHEKPAGTGHGHSHSPDKGITIMLASAALIGPVYFLAQTNESFLYLLSNGLPPLLASAVFVIAAAGLLRNGVKTNDRVSLVWLGCSVGVLFWLLGESTWAVYTLWYSVPIPFPSPADGFWLVGYIPFMSAVLIQSWPFREFFKSRKMLAVILAVFIVAGSLLWALIPATYASEIRDSLVNVVVSLAYPLLDVALLVVSLPVLFLFGKGGFWRPFLFVIIGFILALFGDILFTWATLNSVYYDGSYLELFFHWSYLAFAYGFYLRFRAGIRANMLA